MIGALEDVVVGRLFLPSLELLLNLYYNLLSVGNNCMVQKWFHEQIVLVYFHFTIDNRLLYKNDKSKARSMR